MSGKKGWSKRIVGLSRCRTNNTLSVISTAVGNWEKRRVVQWLLFPSRIVVIFLHVQGTGPQSEKVGVSLFLGERIFPKVPATELAAFPCSNGKKNKMVYLCAILDKEHDTSEGCNFATFLPQISSRWREISLVKDHEHTGDTRVSYYAQSFSCHGIFEHANVDASENITCNEASLFDKYTAYLHPPNEANALIEEWFPVPHTGTLPCGEVWKLHLLVPRLTFLQELQRRPLSFGAKGLLSKWPNTQHTWKQPLWGHFERLVNESKFNTFHCNLLSNMLGDSLADGGLVLQVLPRVFYGVIQCSN